MQKFDINTSIAPGNTADISDLVDFTMDPTKGYNMKVVSSRVVESFYVNSATQGNLIMDMRSVPKYVPSSFTTTLLYSVVNNMSNNNILYNITPEMTETTLSGTDVFAQLSGPTLASYPVLAPGDIAVFEYVYTMTGDVDNAVRFNATLANSLPDN